MDRPLILVDVDGVLNCLAFDPPSGYLSYRSNGFNLAVNPECGKKLIDLADKHGAELVWATLWEDRANEFISPLVGLPSTLRVISFKNIGWSLRALSFKQPTVAAWLDVYAPNSPIVWFDDDVYEDAFRWATRRSTYAAPTYVCKCDPLFGLSNRAIARADRFLTQALLAGSVHTASHVV